MRKPLLISLFSGPGGLDEGFKRAGFQTLYAMDKDPVSVETHRLNHPEANAVVADITTLEVDQLIQEWNQRVSEAGLAGATPMGIIGGPPCQSFSYANTNQRDDDERHLLPSHYARIIKGLREHGWLDFFVFENVPGLKGLHKEKFERFKSQCEAAGFVLFESILEAWQFGVPQLRPRVFVVGIREGHPAAKTFEFPPPLITDISEARTVRDAIGHLPEPVFFQKGLQSHQIPFHPNHWCMRPRSSKFAQGLFIKRPGKFGKSFAVLDWDKPSLTVAYGHREVHVHPSGTRRLSVYEAMMLQGFPPNYRLTGTLSDQIRLVSEAVAPPVAFHLARSIAKHLRITVQENPEPSWIVKSRNDAAD